MASPSPCSMLAASAANTPPSPYGVRISPRHASPTRAEIKIISSRIFLLASLLGATLANAASQPPVAWACWLSEQTPVSIKCIRDRSHQREASLDNEEAALRSLRPDTPDNLEDNPDLPAVAAPGRRGQRQQATMDDLNSMPELPGLRRNSSRLSMASEPEDELEAEVLDDIYNRILAGDTGRLDEVLEKHNDNLRQGSVMVINIHSLPLDSSWAENRPARIVKSALCRGNRSCSVILREPGH